MTQNLNKYRTSTSMLDFEDSSILGLITSRNWQDLDPFERIGAAYNFVRNEIAFGYNIADTIPASRVLRDGYGQCNTKATLLMALLRKLDIPCRLHGFTISKSLQRGVVPELAYKIAPDKILHSWVDVYFDGRWISLEGFILDQRVLGALQEKFKDRDNLCGYGVGTNCLQDPGVEWTGENTYIQETGINCDFGVFDTPDAFYSNHSQNFGFIPSVLYKIFIRHWMNLRVRRMRAGYVPEIPNGPEAAPKRDFYVKERHEKA
ncbi:MAG: transglutaminase-like domain-containing protein [Sneathiella sp.]